MQGRSHGREPRYKTARIPVYFFLWPLQQLLLAGRQPATNTFRMDFSFRATRGYPRLQASPPAPRGRTRARLDSNTDLINKFAQPAPCLQLRVCGQELVECQLCHLRDGDRPDTSAQTEPRTVPGCRRRAGGAPDGPAARLDGARRHRLGSRLGVTQAEPTGREPGSQNSNYLPCTGPN